jgi:hypothetical protein
MGYERNGFRVLVGKSEGKRPLGRHRRSCKNNIKMDLREIEYAGMDWIHLAQNGNQWWALANKCKLLHAGFFLRVFFHPEDGHYLFLRNVG